MAMADLKGKVVLVVNVASKVSVQAGPDAALSDNNN